MTLRALVLVPALLLAMPALARDLPPTNALPLSRVLANIERSQPVRAFTEVEWDDDGYWEIEYMPRNGRRTVKLRIDPVTGASHARDRWQRRPSRSRN